MALFGQKGGRQKTTDYFVAIDAGTNLVKCLVFARTGDDPAKILGKSVIPHAAGSMRGGMIINIPHAVGSMRGGMIINIPDAAVTFRQAVEAAAHQANVKPTSLLMSMPGDLVKSLVTTVHYHRAQPESHIDSGELKKIV